MVRDKGKNPTAHTRPCLCDSEATVGPEVLLQPQRCHGDAPLPPHVPSARRPPATDPGSLKGHAFGDASLLQGSGDRSVPDACARGSAPITMPIGTFREHFSHLKNEYKKISSVLRERRRRGSRCVSARVCAEAVVSVASVSGPCSFSSGNTRFLTETQSTFPQSPRQVGTDV